MMKYELKIADRQYKELQDHLFCGDGKESVAIALCGNASHDNRHVLLVHQVLLIPNELCKERTDISVVWSTSCIEELLEKAMRKGHSVVKFHSHPNGYQNFSHTDDLSDTELFDSVYGWVDSPVVHGSAVMLPSGRLFGRVVTRELGFIKFDKVTIVGDDISCFREHEGGFEADDFVERTLQAFGEATTLSLKSMRVGVVGCSGTGSPVVEQLVRLGVGEIVLVDPDHIEQRNLNRILNSTRQDALEQRLKVEVMRDRIQEIGLGTKVTALPTNMYSDLHTIQELCVCDVLFGCMDSVDGRHLLNTIASFYLIPYFDLGVKIRSDGKGGIQELFGTIHYLKPFGSSLRTRGVYTTEELRAASMLRSDPEHYDEQKKSGYIVDVEVSSPAVISINMQIAAMAVNEFLARVHSYRYDHNEGSAIVRVSFVDNYIQREGDGQIDEYLSKFVGRGRMLPELNMPELSC